MNRVVPALIGFVIGIACIIFLQRSDTSTVLLPEQVSSQNQGSTERPQQPSVPEETIRELARLRAEVTRLRQQAVHTVRPASEPIAKAPQHPGSSGPAFGFSDLSRETWKNAGLATPSAALQTFIWALTSKDEGALAGVSAFQADGTPTPLTGMRLDWPDVLSGVQVLNIGVPDPQNLDVVVAETIAEMHVPSDTGTRVAHGVVRMRFQRLDGAWKFAGRVR